MAGCVVICWRRKTCGFGGEDGGKRGMKLTEAIGTNEIRKGITENKNMVSAPGTIWCFGCIECLTEFVGL